jgi:hypothetical protein
MVMTGRNLLVNRTSASAGDRGSKYWEGGAVGTTLWQLGSGCSASQTLPKAVFLGSVWELS